MGGKHAAPASLNSWPLTKLALALAVVVTAVILMLTSRPTGKAPEVHPALPSATVQLQAQHYALEPYVELFAIGKRVVHAAVWRKDTSWILTFRGKILSIGTATTWCSVPASPWVADQILVATACLQYGSRLPASRHIRSFIVWTPYGPERVKYATRVLLF